MSRMFLVVGSKPLIPLSQRIILSLPAFFIYSAAKSHSLYVADSPLFRITGVFNLPTSFNNS